jgi:MFS family permease
LTEAWKARASNAFNLGGLLGAFIAIPLARHLGRRPMYVCYFLYSAVALFLSFGLPLSPPARVFALFFVGVGVYGIFSTYVFYLPELFPTRLRALGSGFCFNIGRLAAALGPFIVGSIAAQAGGDSRMITTTLFWVGMFPLLAALASLRFVVETRGRALQ